MNTAFTVKSDRVDVLSIILHTNDEEALKTELDILCAGFNDSPESMPFLLDVHKLEDPWGLDIKKLLEQFNDLNLKVIGVRHTEEDYAAKVAQYGLGFSLLRLDDDEIENEDTSQDENSAENEKIKLYAPTMIIDKPVRSGQQIYAKDGDVICLSVVNERAEIIADGNIHIYGALRGRALAGASGDTKARIFVQNMNAQLVSIAGVFRVFDKKLPPSLYGKAVSISLEDDKLNITALNN